MKGTMQISKLKKKAAYYCSKSFDTGYGGEFVFFIEPFDGTYDKCFYYVKELKNGKIEITGEGYIISDFGRIASYRKAAREKLGNDYPAYYWLDDNDEIIEKTYK